MLKGFIYFFVLISCAFGICLYFANENKDYSDHYNNAETVDLGMSDRFPEYELAGFHTEFTVIKNNTEINADDYLENTYAVIMTNNTDRKCIVAHNVHRRIYPASMTKLLTASVVCDAIERGDLDIDKVITLNHEIEFEDPEATQSNLTEGCSITVRNLLYGFMMCSYNDFGVMLSEAVAGTEEEFVKLMNQKAQEIGATNSHFENSHGLDDLNHYTTAYDMYLIINEASKHEILETIDSYTSYTYFYYNEYGDLIQDDIEPTNRFLSDNARLPANIKIKSWKTGTTDLAGYCLALILDINDKEYTIIVTDSEGHNDLYNTISQMFNLSE